MGDCLRAVNRSARAAQMRNFGVEAQAARRDCRTAEQRFAIVVIHFRSRSDPPRMLCVRGIANRQSSSFTTNVDLVRTAAQRTIRSFGCRSTWVRVGNYGLRTFCPGVPDIGTTQRQRPGSNPSPGRCVTPTIAWRSRGFCLRHDARGTTDPRVLRGLKSDNLVIPR